MALVLDGNGTMTVGNGDITGLATGAVEATAIGAGAIRQIVNLNYQTYYTTSTTNSWVTPTGFTASITPTSSSSRILVYYSMTGCCINQNSNTVAKVRARIADGNDTQLFQICEQAWAGGTSGNMWNCFTGCYNHSPATTSTLTYKIQVLAELGSPGFQINNYYTNPQAFSSLMLIEVA